MLVVFLSGCLGFVLLLAVVVFIFVNINKQLFEMASYLHQWRHHVSCEDRLQNDLSCIECDVKPTLLNSIQP